MCGTREPIFAVPAVCNPWNAAREDRPARTGPRGSAPCGDRLAAFGLQGLGLRVWACGFRPERMAIAEGQVAAR